MMPAPPKIWKATDVHTLATWHSLQIVVWKQAPTVTALTDVYKATEALLVHHPDGVAVLGIAQSGMPLIGPEERKLAAAQLKDFGARMKCLCSVIEGDGFWAGATRSVMTAIMMVARPPCPVKTFARVDEAAAWQAPLLGPSISPALYLRAVAEVRQARVVG
jgi:hypothetical protein